MKLTLLFTAALLLNQLSFSAKAQEAASPTLEFSENKGQWDAHARYVAPLPGGRLFAEADGLTFALLANGGPAQRRHGPAPAGPPPAADQPVRGHAFTLHFEGAAPTAVLTAETPTAEHRNYFLGADARHWASDVRSYRTLRYANLWPGIGARVYESAGQQLEYDFTLAPGAQAAAIGVRHDGAEALTLDPEGNLRLQTSVGTVIERAPQAWQTDAAGQRRAVPCRYVLAGRTVRFALGKYDRTRPLVIDPVVSFSTYTGSTADNWGFTATYDSAGNLYSGGIVFGVGYPASPGAFQTSFADVIDIGIIKYNTSATGPAARVWATYVGGNSADFPTSLVVNSQGELLLLGISSSSNYPTTTGALQRAFAGGTAADPYGYGPAFSLPLGSDLVITRLSADGSALVGSTYLGGSGNDGLLPFDGNAAPTGGAAQLAHNYGDPFRGDILVDAADNVYVASNTSSRDFPLAGGFNSTYGGGTSDALVLKLNPTLTALAWGSYLGGAASDAAYSVQLEPASGDVYVAGGTLSANFPTTAGSYQPGPLGNVDGFVARIAATGTGLLRATYLGTSSYDQGYFLQLGTDGGVYVLGQTAGAYPTTLGLYGTPNGRQFIHKLDANLATTQLATVFGSGRSSIDLDPTAFLVDRCDRVYVCGWGGTLNQNTGGAEPYLSLNGDTAGLPITTDALQPATDANDFYLAQFSAGLTGLAYATYYGAAGGQGDHVDGGTARFDPRGIVYQAVCSCGSTNGFPIPPGANTYATLNRSGNCNNAAFVFNFQPNIANAGADQGVCATAGPQALVGTPAGGVWTGPGVSGNLATGFAFTPSAALTGVQTITYTVLSTGLCTTTGTRRVTVTTPPTVTFTPLPQSVYCQPGPGAPALPVVPLTATPVGGVFSGPGVSGSVATGFVFSPNIAPVTGQITYTLNVAGCVVLASQPVAVTSAANAGTDQAVCATAGPQALVGTPAGGVWTGPGVSGSVAAGFVFLPSAALAGVQTVTYTVGGSCTGTRRITVRVPPVVAFEPLPQATYCLPAAGAPALPAVPLRGTPAGGIFSGPGVSGNVAAGFVFSPGLNLGTVRLVYTLTTGECTTQATQTVTLLLPPTPLLPPDTVLCPGSSQSFALRGSPAGGVFSGPGVSGSEATGFRFTPPTSFPSPMRVTYSVSSGGCVGTATRQIAIAPVPLLEASWTPVACPETRLAPLTLRFTLTPLISLLPPMQVWDFGDGTQSTEANPTHTYTAPGSYQPRLRARYNLNRCETTVPLPLVEVQKRRIPNIITPNGDGQNQTFQLGTDCAPHLQVFSRWGQRVFDSAQYHDEWNAEGQPNGTYYYLAAYPDGHRLKGWVEVVR